MRAFQRKSFDYGANLCVRFAGEDGIDDGGPSREFMRLALIGISSLPIFEGKGDQKMLALDYKGKLVLLSNYPRDLKVACTLL